MPSPTALFASSSGRSQNKNLVEFKAGKMTMKGKMVHPDKRKGLLYVYQSEDYLIHFCWKDRNSGTVEDDLIIFPDDCEFKRVEACTTGRVYILKFKSSNRKFFFWLQEAKTDKDEENCKKVNEMLNNPPTVASSRSGGGTPDDIQNLLGSMSQQQLMQLFGSMAPGGSGTSQVPSSLSSLLGAIHRSGSASRTPTTTTATVTSTPSSTTTDTLVRAGSSTTTSSSGSGSKPSSGTPASGGAIQLSDLQRFLSNITSNTSSPLPPEPTVDVDLSEALLSAESIQGVLNDPGLVRELSPHLPDVDSEQPGTERLRDTLVSPQFQLAVRRFGAALSTGQIGPVVEQFQVGDSAVLAAIQGNMEEFVKALEKTTLSKEGDSGEKSGESSGDKSKKDDKDDKDKDEKMQED